MTLLYHVELFVTSAFYINIHVCEAPKTLLHVKRIQYTNHDDFRLNLDEIIILLMIPMITIIPIAELNSGIDVFSVKSFNVLRMDLSYNIA